MGASIHSARTAQSQRSAHSTRSTQSDFWSPKRIAIYALLVALSMVLSFIEFPLIPSVPYLKYDPSGIVALVGGFIFGPKVAAIVSVLGFLPHLANPWGALMAIVVAVAFSVPAAIVYRAKRTRLGLALALLVGALCALVAAIIGNVIVTPLYAGMSTEQVIAMIVPVLLPFNLIKFTIHAVVAFLIMEPVSRIFARSAGIMTEADPDASSVTSSPSDTH